MAKEETLKLGMEDGEVINFINSCWEEARDAKQYRLARNKTNNEAMLGQQDWSHKNSGQSMEFLPKTGIAVEQFAAFIKRGMVQAGPDWFEFVPPRTEEPSPLNAREMRLLLADALDNCLLEDNVVGEFHTSVTDAIKLAATESLAIFKVHGQQRPIMALGQSPHRDMVWSLRIDVIPFEAYSADPTGKGLYEIHTTERDLWEVQQRAQEGVYDKKAVDKLTDSCRISEEERRDAIQKGGE